MPLQQCSSLVNLLKMSSSDSESSLSSNESIESSTSSSEPSKITEYNDFLLNSKLVKCEVCNTVEAKYTCPKCEVRTCSLACVKIHKKELDCDGIRNRVAFKPVSKMTNLDLLSDYRLLEEAGRSVYTCKRGLTRPGIKDLPIHLQKLRRAANARGTQLELLPQQFARRKSNTTYLDWKTNILSWRVEWVFAEAENSKFIDERVIEDLPIAEQLETHYLSPLVQNRTIKIHKAAGAENLVLLLVAENVVKSGSSRFFQLNPSQPLKTNLRGKTIVEFPTIYVVLKSNISNYDIIDLEEVKKIADAIGSPGKELAPQQQNRKRGANCRRQQNTKHENKNLLFCQSDSSESEEPREESIVKVQRVVELTGAH